MQTRDAAQYLEEQYGIEVKPDTIPGWIKKEYLEGCKEGGRWCTTQEALDAAVHTKNIPPKPGRKRRYSATDRERMRDMYAKGQGKHTLSEIAEMFGCDESYVSLVVRNLR